MATHTPMEATLYSSILVPLDGSKFSESVLPIAVDLARATGATLHLAAVQEPIPPGATAESHGEHLSAIVGDWLTSYLAEARQRAESGNGSEVRTALLHGRAAGALLEYATGNEIDLVVMTTHGQRGLSRAWLGSVADRLARTSTVPLLLLRPPDDDDGPAAPRLPFRRMLIPLDGSELAESVLPHALRLAEVSDAACVLLRVVPPRFTVGSPYLPHTVQINREHTAEQTKEAREYLEGLAAGIRSERDRVVDLETPNAGDVARTIILQAAELGVDVIAIATHGRGGLRRAVLGSVADKVLRGSSLPVLLVRGSG